MTFKYESGLSGSGGFGGIPADSYRKEEKVQKKVAFHNLGCKVNAYETETMLAGLLEDGCLEVPLAPGADIYIINTCTVTNVADRKSRQMLHKTKEMNRMR